MTESAGTGAARPSELLRRMFDEMVVPKDGTRIEEFYHPDFEMSANGIIQGFDDFASGHRAVYGTDVGYAIRYDEDTWLETADSVAVRLWITTSWPDKPATELELVLIARYLDGRMHRLWEVSWPDWSRLEGFRDYPGVESP